MDAVIDQSQHNMLPTLTVINRCAYGVIIKLHLDRYKNLLSIFTWKKSSFKVLDVARLC